MPKFTTTPKPVRAAVRQFVQTERHPSSANPMLQKNKNSFKTTRVGHESESGSKGEELCEAAHSMYQRAVGAPPDSKYSDQALRER